MPKFLVISYSDNIASYDNIEADTDLAAMSIMSDVRPGSQIIDALPLSDAAKLVKRPCFAARRELARSIGARTPFCETCDATLPEGSAAGGECATCAARTATRRQAIGRAARSAPMSKPVADVLSALMNYGAPRAHALAIAEEVVAGGGSEKDMIRRAMQFATTR